MMLQEFGVIWYVAYSSKKEFRYMNFCCTFPSRPIALREEELSLCRTTSFPHAFTNYVAEFKACYEKNERTLLKLQIFEF